MHKENCDAGQQMPEFGHPPLSDSVYDIIDRKGDELRQRGIGEEDISRIINAELEYDMKQFTSRMPQSKVNRESLYKVESPYRTAAECPAHGPAPGSWP